MSSLSVAFVASRRYYVSRINCGAPSRMLRRLLSLHASIFGVWRGWRVGPNSGVFASCLYYRFGEEGEMSLSYRARAIDAATRGVPAEDVLRLVRPAQYLQVLKSTHEA